MTAHSGDVCRSARFWATCRAGSVVVDTVSLFLVWSDFPSDWVWGAPATVPCCRALAGYSQCGSDRLDRTGCSALQPWGATCRRGTGHRVKRTLGKGIVVLTALSQGPSATSLDEGRGLV